MCRVLNKRKSGIPAGAIYIGRGSKWGNPFRIGPDGDRATVIAKHERWLREQHHLLRAIDELRGHDLVCFCAPLACHGDLLLWLPTHPRFGIAQARPNRPSGIEVRPRATLQTARASMCSRALRKRASRDGFGRRGREDACTPFPS